MSTTRSRNRSLRGKIFGTLVIALALSGIVGWSYAAPLNSAIVSIGQFVVSGERQKVQHRKGGLVALIHVQAGELVNKGQVVVDLDTKELELRRTQAEKTTASLAERIAIVEEEYAMVRKLFKKGYANKPRYLALKRTLAELKGRKEEVAMEQKTIELDIKRSVVRAPISGTVIEITTNTIGQVIEPGETLLEIVPENTPMYVESRISPDQIDNVSKGLDVELRLTGFNQRTTPELKAKLSYVGADAMTDEKTDENYFVIRSELVPGQEERLEQELSPGTPAEVVVMTGPRTMFEYMTKPLMDSLSRAMREG